MERGEFGACTFVELSGAEHPKAVQHMRVEHVALTARSDVLVKIHWVVADGSLHSDETKALEEMAKKFAESIGVPLVTTTI